MQTSVTQWGNSLAIRIPKPFAVQTGITQDGVVGILLAKDKIVVFKTKISLSELLQEVNTDNIHDETDTGNSIGKET